MAKLTGNTSVSSPEYTHRHTHTHTVALKLFTINASATVSSAAATSDINFMAVEDLQHPLPQSRSLYFSFTIHCTDVITIHFREKPTKKPRKNKSDAD